MRIFALTIISIFVITCITIGGVFVYQETIQGANNEVATEQPLLFNNQVVSGVSGRAYEPNPPATIIFTGDTMLGRYVETLMNIHGDTYPFENIADTLMSADFVVSNLEGPIPEHHTQTPNNSLSFSFRESTASLLSDNNIQLISQANNHGHDKGIAAAKHTREVLDEAGVKGIGDTTTVSSESSATLIINGRKITIIGLNDVFGILDLDDAVNLVAQEEGSDTSTIVFIHWGDEYQKTNNARQESVATALVQAGADAIIGHHPHVVQNVEILNGVPVFYSLGNFIFDQYFSRDVQEGLMVSITLTDDTTLYELLPTQSTNSQPRLMEKSQKNAWLAQFATTSSTASAQVERGQFKLTR